MERLAARLEADDVDGALALFDRLPADKAALPQNRVMRSTVLVSAGRPAEARRILEAVIKEDKSHIEARYALSAVEAVEKNLRQQRILLEDIVKERPGFVPALNDLGEIDITHAKNIKRAAARYDAALKAEPDNRNSLMGRARVYRLEKKYDEAFGLLNRAVELYPASAVLYDERARLFRERDALDDALADIDTAVALEPRDYWFAYDRALILLNKNMKKEALAEFNRAVSINPDMFVSYVYTAGISDELGLDAEAERNYKKLALINPDYYFAFEGLGVQNLKKRDYLAAKDSFIQAWGRAPAETHYALLGAYSWLKAGKTPEIKARVKELMGDAIKQAKRESLDYYVLRMFLEGMGDGDVARRAEKENGTLAKARAYFYLACYYDINGMPALAGEYAEKFKVYNRRDIVEFRINEFLYPENEIAVKK